MSPPLVAVRVTRNWPGGGMAGMGPKDKVAVAVPPVGSVMLEGVR